MPQMTPNRKSAAHCPKETPSNAARSFGQVRARKAIGNIRLAVSACPTQTFSQRQPRKYLMGQAKDACVIPASSRMATLAWPPLSRKGISPPPTSMRTALFRHTTGLMRMLALHHRSYRKLRLGRTLDAESEDLERSYRKAQTVRRYRQRFLILLNGI